MELVPGIGAVTIKHKLINCMYDGKEKVGGPWSLKAFFAGMLVGVKEEISLLRSQIQVIQEQNQAIVNFLNQQQPSLAIQQPSLLNSNQSQDGQYTRSGFHRCNI